MVVRNTSIEQPFFIFGSYKGFIPIEYEYPSDVFARFYMRVNEVYARHAAVETQFDDVFAKQLLHGGVDVL
jgi:Ni,Fe-hydrogenase III large subunit